MSFQPPTQPPAGWHPDPYRPGYDRYWNGLEWVEQWRPSPGAAPMPPGTTNPNGLPDIAGWLGRAFNRAFLRWRSATLLGLVASVLPTLLFTVSAAYLVDDLIITTNGSVVGWSNSRIPLAVAMAAVALAILSIGSLAMQSLMLRTVDQEPDPSNPIGRGGSPVGRATAALTDGLRCLPRAIGWIAILVLGFAAFVVVYGILVVVTGGAFLLTLFILIPAGIWLAIRWSFVVVAIVDAPGNPFARSSAVVQSRWWAVFGRLLLLGIITGVISSSINAATNGTAGSGAFSDNLFEIDANGNLTNDIVVGDFVSTSPLFVVLTVLGSLLVNLVTAVTLAGTAELYRTRHRPPATG